MTTPEERLARIEEHLKAIATIWEFHTQQDMEQFELLRTEIKEVGTKVDELRLAEATRKGEASVTKRSAGVLGGGVAAIVVAGVEAVRYFLGV